MPKLQGDYVVQHFGIAVFPCQKALPVLVDFGQTPDPTAAELSAKEDILHEALELMPHPSAVKRTAKDAFILAFRYFLRHKVLQSFTVD